ncbi:MAG TPA: hypothetical protein IAA26_14435 [Candidatus Blautia faecipullorum]|nr:hypothetical protein [Candidatus Blautia faecipullorum]
MKKKLVTGILCAAVLAGTVAPVHAENTTEGTMNVKYKEGNVYVISIPSSVTLQQGKETTAEQIKATSMNVEPRTEVVVMVTDGINEKGAVSLALSYGESADTVTSTVSLTSGGTGIDTDTVVASFSGQSLEPESGTGTLYFSGLPEGMKAGTWKGQLTFTVGTMD